MKGFPILLVACWLISNDVSCNESNETIDPVSDQESLNDTKTEEVQGRNHHNNSQESEKLCPCFLNNIKGRAPVFQNLDVNQFGIRRLVMYLYYSDATNQLEVHVPNLEKQKIIPDIYEKGDILETIETPCVINTFKRYIDLIQSSNQDDSEGNDELHPGKNKYLTTHNDPDYESSETSNDYNSKSSDNSSSETDESIESHPITPFKKIIFVNGKPVSLNMLNYVKGKQNSPHKQNIMKPSFLATVPKVVPINNYLKNKVNKYLQYTPSDSFNYDKKVYPYSVPSYNRNKLQNLNVPFDDTLEPTKKKYPNMFWKYPDQSNKHLQNENSWTLPNIDEWKNEYPFIPWPHNRTNKPYHLNGGNYYKDGDSSEETQNNHLYNKYFGDNQSWPLDLWLQEQTKKLHKPSKNTLFDVNNIKFHLEQILLANDMTVSPYGYIINGAGQIVDMDRFSLRPILIGGPIALKHILNNKNEFRLPNSPYLKAVLLTSSNPTKILGTIPLGKEYLPSGELKYSGEVNKDEHDYNVPSVSLYNLIDDNKMNLKYSLVSPQTARKQTHYTQNIDLNRSGEEYDKEVIDLLLKGLITQVDILQNNINNVLQNKDSEDNIDQSRSDKHVHSNKTHQHLKSTNQTDEHVSQNPVTILNQTHSEAENENDHDKSDTLKNDRSAEDSSNLRRGSIYNKRKLKGKQPVYKRPYWIRNRGRQGTEIGSSQMYEDLPGYRILPGKIPRKRQYTVESFNHYKHKPISSEVYRPNVDSNDSLNLYPGFRIIGGHAATSSGAPLSNKGRSGHINDSVSQDDDAE